MTPAQTDRVRSQKSFRANPQTQEKVIDHLLLPARESEWYQQICSGENTLADAIMDCISYDSYKINIEIIDPSRDLSMKEAYGLDPAQAE